MVAPSVSGSTADTLQSSSVVRSRVWSEDITRNWNKTSSQMETIEGRLERYSVYFSLESDQLNHIMQRFIDEVDVGLKLHQANPTVQWSSDKCSLKLLDTCVHEIPTGQEQGVSYALDFGGTNLRSVRVQLNGNGNVSLAQIKTSLREAAPDLENGLLDKDATATQLFDTFAESLKRLMQKHGDLHTANKWLNVGFTFSFPINQKSLKVAYLVGWTKEFETGRNTGDQVEGMDIGALLDQALWRKEVPAKGAAVLNDTTGTLLSCAYEKPLRSPPCLIGLILGTGTNGCYFQDDAGYFGYTGRVINTELGAFDKGLPTNDVDLEVDFAYEPNRGQQLFEKMVSGMYMGEMCRRLVLKVYQKAAPELAWQRESLPAEAAAMILNDATPQLLQTRAVVEGLWEWEADDADLRNIQRMVTLVFDRSAALAAAVIAGMAKKTGRLQPAMGGLTVGIDGSLYTQNKRYADKVRYYLDMTLGAKVASLVNLCVSTDGSGKGAAILAAVQEHWVRDFSRFGSV